MRKLAEAFYADSPLMGYPMMTLLLFIIIFSVIAYRVYRRGKSDYSHAEALPLDDGIPVFGGHDHG